MNVLYKLPQETLKIIERLFVFVDTKDIEQNIRLGLVVNPEIIKILLKQAEEEPLALKIELYRTLSDIFARNKFNSLILAKRDREIMQFNHSILQSLIFFVYSLKQHKDIKELANRLVPFVQSYAINGKILKSILSVVIKDFYYQQISNPLLVLSIELLKNIMKHQYYKQGQPNCYFITYGQETGVKMINKNLKWPFSKGFHLYIKFYIQQTIDQDMILFTIALENDEFVIFVNSEGELKIKVFAQTESLTISTLPQQQWITLALSYTLKSKLLKNYYEIHCIIDGEIHERRDLPVPQQVGMTDQITELSFGRSFYGLIHTAILSRSEIVLWNKLTLNTWAEIESFLVINKKVIREFFVLYHPILTTCINQKDMIYDITSQNHGQIFQNTGIYLNPFKSADINYYGGLYTFLPYLHLLKFYNYDKSPNTLTQIFELYLIFFDNGFLNVEVQAINCQFFSIASQLINEISHQYIKRETIQVIKKMNNCMTNIMLKKDFFVNFLWKINIKKVEDPMVVEGIFQIIEQYFLQYFEWSYGLISIDDIFHYIIDNFEPSSSNQCCFHHYALSENRSETIDPYCFANHLQTKTRNLRNILKIIFMNLVNFQSILPIRTKIMHLLFGDYSSCLKLLLLQSLNEGAKIKASFYIEEFNLLNYLYLYLPIAHLPQEIAIICQSLLHIQEQDEDNELLEKTIIQRIAECFQKIYSKKCEDVRFRSRTDKIRQVRLLGERKHYSEEKQVKETQKKCKKLSRGSSIQNSKLLYESLVKLCFYYDVSEEECLLKHDGYVLILQPYFKICGLQFKKNIINMIRNTVILASNGKSIIDNLTKFDKLYKLLLNEFVLKELDPNSSDYIPTQQNNYIIRNVYFVIDYMIMGIRNDWVHLYIFLLRLLSLLDQVKKEIQKKTLHSIEDITFAVRVTTRKFILRVVKLAEKNVHNLPNLVFIVYLTVFGNDHGDESISIFRYYKSFEQCLFINRLNIVNSQAVDVKDQSSFVDSKLILDTVSSFKLCTLDLRKTTRIKVINFINSYIDLQYTNQDSEMYKNRLIYLITAQFKLKIQDASVKNIFSGFFGENNSQKVSIGQIISIMLGLCVQSSINTENIGLLKESLKILQTFYISFLLLCSRDGLKRQQHKKRDTKLPQQICLKILHFLYSMLQGQLKEGFKELIEDSLYYFFYFSGLIVNCFYDKFGHPQGVINCLELAAIQKSAEEYNLFIFELVKPVFSLKQIIKISVMDKQKALDLLHSERISQYFQNNSLIPIEKKIQEVVRIHKDNLNAVKKEIEEEQINSTVVLQEIAAEYLINKEQFEKTFLLDYLKKNNLNYRRIQRIWHKIWKRLRLYHHFWSVSMNQRQRLELEFKKNCNLPFKHKFSKFLDNNGVRSILQVQPIEPWHVKRVLMQKEFEYRNSNYLYHLHQSEQTKKRQKSIFQKIITKSVDNNAVFFVDWIKNNSKRKGHLSIEQQKLKFKYLSTFQKDSHLEFTSFILAEYKPVEKYWPLIEIVDIIERRYLTKKQCLLIEFQDSTSLIFNFINQDKEEFLKMIQQKQSQKADKLQLLKLNRIAFYTKRFTNNPYSAIEEATALWKARRISNFRYLMLVNKYSGRSYLDPANYPVFPWVISSYESEQITHRDLSKTIGALGSQQLVQQYRNKTLAVDPFDPVPPYQFGTHYSSPGMVFNFLIRLQPYTEASRTLQGGKFDLSDRLFNSLRICWHSITSQLSDVRQLIPEFYYLPEFLLNIQQHNFGLTQLKDRVHNVYLPPWSRNAYQFISINRRQLQSDSVSQHLGLWIDLIFGFKQKGKIAEENLNLFYYLTYQNCIDLEGMEEGQAKISKEAQIMHFGQTPSQIFTKPHPSRNKSFAQPMENYKKIRFLLSLESGSVSVLWKGESKMVVFHQYCINVYHEQNTFSLASQTKLLRNNSRQNIYFIEDLDFSKKIILFGQQKFIVIASYVNGDLIVYSLPEGKKIQQKKGSPKNCIFINHDENLLFCGCKNGLLEVYEIVYGQKETVTLIKIAFQYYQSPIVSISEGGNFYAITSGNLVVIVKISRSLTYVYDKIKMRGIKMIRSIESNKKLEGALLCSEQLFCIIIYNSLEMSSYSINGQLLKSRQIEMALPPQRFRDENFCYYIAVVEDKKLVIYSTPFLEVVRTVSLPNKIFKEMRFYDNKCYLTTNFGEILCLSHSESKDE